MVRLPAPPMRLSAASDTVPPTAALAPVPTRVPTPLTPVPDSVSPSVPMLTPLISSVAPLATAVPPDALPSAALLLATRVPVLTVVLPL